MTSQAVSDNFQMFRMLERQTGLYLLEKVYPSSELRTAMSNSKTASLAVPSNDENTMRAHFVLSSNWLVPILTFPSVMYCIYL